MELYQSWMFTKLLGINSVVVVAKSSSLFEHLLPCQELDQEAKVANVSASLF